jgi:hypothetical protein
MGIGANRWGTGTRINHASDTLVLKLSDFCFTDPSV